MIVYDTSTLILLAKIDILRYAAERFSSVMPEVVFTEATCKRTMDAAVISQLVDEKTLIVVANPSKKKMHCLLSKFPVAEGETASFLIAKEKKAVLATDDGIAIKMCKIFGVQFANAIHFLIEMKKRKCFDEQTALAKLGLLERYGRYSPEIIKDATERISGR